MTNSRHLFNMAFSLMIIGVIVSGCGLKQQPKPPADVEIKDPHNYPKER